MHDKDWKIENTYRELPQAFFTDIELNPVKNPELIVLNSSLAKDLGLDAEKLQTQVEILAGNELPKGSKPIAKAYAGHQFGNFTILGDGRAILLGEQITPSGERFDIELKGSGRTPYSRGGDGRASVGPMLREYIISEAMHALGIPTTRGLAVVRTGEKVSRQSPLPGAILTRVASSHLRVGTFEYAASRGNEEELRALADYTIGRHFKNIKNDSNAYLSLLKEVIDRQASLISKWQLVGFIHGVMNTDNTTISGETIDYGSCAFMDVYNPKKVFSSIDRAGRYAYENQPGIGLWNLSRLAETLIPLIDKDTDKSIELCKDALNDFQTLSEQYFIDGMRKKLGIFDKAEEDKKLIEDLLDLMYQHKTDFTNTFRGLTLRKYENCGLFESDDFKEWERSWKIRLEGQNESLEESQKLMKKTNPSVIPRNHRVEEALKEAEFFEDYTVMEDLMEVLKNPFDYSEKHEEYAKLPEKPNENYQTYCGT